MYPQVIHTNYIMNYLKNYNDYANFVKTEVRLGKRPKNKKDYANNFRGKQYFEFHHIVPKCMGGDESEDNYIALTAREHFLAHYLLIKIYPNDYKLGIAFGMFCMNKHNFNHTICYFNSRLYESVKSHIDYGATSRGKKRSEEFCKKVSEGNRGKKHSDEWNRHVAENHADCSGEKNSMYGRKHTEESKALMSEHQKLTFTPERRKQISNWAKVHHIGEGNPRAKKVRCIETGQVFNTVKDAAIWAHGSVVSKCTISFCCKGTRNIAFGYHWEYVEV